uniref:Uncharacterized protein n=1 Tax=Romanomermis culicivorax TaxID=13658 RepID=A0A915IZS5_ROMCU
MSPDSDKVLRAMASIGAQKYMMSLSYENLHVMGKRVAIITIAKHCSKNNARPGFEPGSL